MDSSTTNGCVLLFSGGRDSTIAAVRLGQTGEQLTLLTITSEHLVGLSNVRRRIVELRPYLPDGSVWVHGTLRADAALAPPVVGESCLPCHQAYIAAALWVANQSAFRSIAVGYAGYQSTWLEQSPYAIARLRDLLELRGKQLLTPVYDLNSKDEANAILRGLNLTDAPLEQKCLKQQFNLARMSDDEARREIDSWASHLGVALRTPELPGLMIGRAIDVMEVQIDAAD